MSLRLSIVYVIEINSFNPWWCSQIQGVILVDTFFVAEYMVNFEEYSMMYGEKDIYYYVWVKYSVDISQIHYCSFQFLSGLDDPYIGEGQVLKYPTFNLWGSMYHVSNILVPISTLVSS